MSVAGVSSSSFVDYGTQGVQSTMQQFRKDFQQLGQDLQSGNLSAAQSDFASIQQLQTGSSSTSSASSTSPTSSSSSTSSTSSSQSSNSVAQAFNQLSQDLQSGNLPAAQQDYAKIQQDFQSQGTQEHHHHHHQPHHGEGSGTSGSGSDSISQIFGQLGQALQSGNLSSAQQAYNTLQQDFQQFAQNNGAPSTQSSQSTATQPSEITVTAWTITISVVEETSSSSSVSLNA
jgi:hypothetical protein